jgi:hypothetical protein
MPRERCLELKSFKEYLFCCLIVRKPVQQNQAEKRAEGQQCRRCAGSN